MSEKTTAGEDLLIGAAAIGEFLGISERAARHVISNATLPVFKFSGRICARRSTLSAFLSEAESRGAQPFLEKRLAG